MDGQEYLYEIRRTVTGTMSRGETLSMCGLGIASEAGEVAGLIKKHLYQGHELPMVKVREELGDVLWYLTLLAWECGYTLEDIIAANVAKQKARYPDGWDAERSKKRGEA